MDPFGDTCDPRLYVPRLGTEASLTALREGIARGRRVSVLSGPPGLGKTMVLHVLASRLAPARCVHLPYPALAIEGLAHWALESLGETVALEHACAALMASARRVPDAPLVLLIDDASGLQLPTARALRELVDALGGALRVVAAVVDDPRATAVIAALGDDLLHVRLRHALTPPEVHGYVRGRMERAESEAARALVDEQIAWLARESAGVPRMLNALATWLLRLQSGDVPYEWIGDGEETEPIGLADRAKAEPLAAGEAARFGEEVRESGDSAWRAPRDGVSRSADALQDAAANEAPPPARRRRRLRRHRDRWH